KMKQTIAIERILQHLESRSFDLTYSYDNWLKIGFAFSSLGESGRDYFHRVSRFHPNYDHQECDQQFTHCLASKGAGVSLGSFFHLAREAGIPLSPNALPPTGNAAGGYDPELDDLDDEQESQK